VGNPLSSEKEILDNFFSNEELQRGREHEENDFI